MGEKEREKEREIVKEERDEARSDREASERRLTPAIPRSNREGFNPRVTTHQPADPNVTLPLYTSLDDRQTEIAF